MLFKKTFPALCIIIFLFCMASVCAQSINDDSAIADSIPDEKSNVLNSSSTGELILESDDDVLSAGESRLNTAIGAFNMSYSIVNVMDDGAKYPIRGIVDHGCLLPTPLEHKMVNIKFNGIEKSFITNSLGLITFVIPNNTALGNYTIDMAFKGDETYQPSSVTRLIKIERENTKIIADSTMTVLVRDLDNAHFNLTLVDAKDNPLTGQIVTIEYNGVSDVFITDEKGMISYDLSESSPDKNILTMNFAATEYYGASNAGTVISVAEKTSKIFLRNALYFALQTKYVTVTLWDGDNNPIAGKTVHINLDEYGLKYSGVTDRDGNAHIRVGIGFGVHNATVSFDGDEIYGPSRRTGSIRVIKETPSVMVRGTDTQFRVNDDSKLVKVYLWDRTSKPLPVSSKIVIKINGRTYIEYTDFDGIARIKININRAGTYNAEVAYGGNSAYNAVTRPVKIVVR